MFIGLNWWLAAAALASFVTFAIHTFVGTGQIARPLLDPGLKLSSVSRYTNYYCWHLVTITLLAQAACFAWAALPSRAPDLAVLATVLAAGFLAWNITLNLWRRLPIAVAPQWVFFAPITILGAVGLATW